MRISRWISVPMAFAIPMGIILAIAGENFWFDGFLYGFSLGAVEGLIIQAWSDHRTKRISRTSAENDFSVLQGRSLVVLANLDVAFRMCKDAFEHLENAIVKKEDKNKGLIMGRTNFNFHSFGTVIEIRLKPLNNNLTEIEISSRPWLRTTVVDYGESLRVAEEVVSFLKKKDGEINRKVLVKGVGILNEICEKPFIKEKIV